MECWCEGERPALRLVTGGTDSCPRRTLTLSAGIIRRVGSGTQCWGLEGPAERQRYTPYLHVNAGGVKEAEVRLCYTPYVQRKPREEAVGVQFSRSVLGAENRGADIWKRWNAPFKTIHFVTYS